jgi:hypothetical protein
MKSASGVYGVTPSRCSRTNPWKAAVKINGKLAYLGLYPTIEAAKAAVDAVKRPSRAPAFRAESSRDAAQGSAA